MTKKSFILHATWLLVAIGAYAVGTFQPRHPAVFNNTASRTLVTLPDPRVPQAAKSSKEKEQFVARVAAQKEDPDAVGWLQPFRSADGSISPERMTEAVQGALRESDPVKSMLYFAQLVKELTPENAPAALKAVREGPAGMESMRYMSLLAHAWGEKDGAGAVAALDQVRGRESGWAKSTALAAWAASDPKAALQWMQEHTAKQAEQGGNRDGREDGALTRGLISGLARQDIDGALNYLMTLKEDQRGEYVGVLAEQKLKEGADTASNWALGLADPRMRSNALAVVSRQFLRQDLQTATNWAATIAGQPGAEGAVGQVADQFADRNIPEAAAWASKLPPGESQNEAFREVFSEWTDSNPLAASQALTQMAPSPARDAAIDSFSRNLARENPQDAMAWAIVITEPRSRLNAQTEIARRWYQTAPNDAQPWIAANLPPDMQARALAPREDRGRWEGRRGGR